MSRLVLVRHGQSQWNLENRFTGWVDVDLTEKGREEARNAGVKLADMTFDRAFVSGLRRAADTLSLILQETGQNQCPITADPALNERIVRGIARPEQRRNGRSIWGRSSSSMATELRYTATRWREPQGYSSTGSTLLQGDDRALVATRSKPTGGCPWKFTAGPHHGTRKINTRTNLTV
jgi:phosphoglycerate mutase, BPG-dependent, family 1